MGRPTKLKLRSYTGPAESSGRKPCVYVQVMCGRKAGSTRFYVGETKRGHAARYTGKTSNSVDRLRLNARVNLVLVEDGELRLTMARRLALESLIVLEVKQRPVGKYLATQVTCDINDLLDPHEIPVLRLWARKVVAEIEKAYEGILEAPLAPSHVELNNLDSPKTKDHPPALWE